MKVTEKNIEKFCEVLNNTFNHTSVMEYSGWTDQVNPFYIVTRSNEEKLFCKEYPSNIFQNRFSYAEIGDCIDEKFIRLVSNEYDVFDKTKHNFVIRVGMDISVNPYDKQIVIIDSENSLKKLLKKNDDVFTVFLFHSQNRLNELNEFCI